MHCTTLMGPSLQQPTTALCICPQQGKNQGQLIDIDNLQRNHSVPFRHQSSCFSASFKGVCLGNLLEIYTVFIEWVCSINHIVMHETKCIASCTWCNVWSFLKNMSIGIPSRPPLLLPTLVARSFREFPSDVKKSFLWHLLWYAVHSMSSHDTSICAWSHS